MSDDWPESGTLLAARYRLVRLLETGGMAEIWRADDELLGRPVAVKLPTGNQVAWREARMAAKLQHPGIAAVHDYREAVRADGTVAPFVVMELLAGETVAARLERETFALPDAARIGAAVADALAAAHANGVIHRDIKPGNVMLTPNGVKILDFGISAAAGEPDDDDTGATFGTPAYVAPERLDGMPAEPATDVYGLGVLLFEMVTGDPPYPVETWEELAEARAKGPGVLPADLPESFRDLVEQCLDDDPGARPGAEEIRFDLNALWLRDRPAVAAPVYEESAPRRAQIWPGPAPTQPGLDGFAAPGKNVAFDEAWGQASPGRQPVRAEFVDWPDRSSGYQPGRAAATGRAPADTVALEPPKRPRRVAFTLALVALVVAIGGTFALINWRPQKPATDAAPPPSNPATTSSSPTPEATTPAPPQAAPPTPARRSPKPKPSPTLTFADAVTRMQSAIEDGASSGDIRSDVATDLLNFLQPLSGADGSDVGDQVGQLRRKLRDRAAEGEQSMSRDQVSILQARLNDLDRAAGT